MTLALLLAMSAVMRVVPAAAVTTGLVSWWQANGNANDSVGGNNGTPENGVTYTAGYPSGRAFNFDGSNDISIGNPSNLQSHGGNFTIAAWVNFSSLGGDESIVSKMLSSTSVGGTNSDGWRLLKQSDGLFWFCVGHVSNGCYGADTTAIATATPPQLNTWYFVAGVYSASQGLAIYVNGVLEGTAPGNGYVNTDAAPMYIGWYPFESHMNGAVDDVQYYDQALSPAEIQELAGIVSLKFTGSVNYANTGPPTLGITVAPSSGRVSSVLGTDTIPGLNGGQATITVQIIGLFGVIYVGLITVVDPSAGLNTTSFVFTRLLTRTANGLVSGTAFGYSHGGYALSFTV